MQKIPQANFRTADYDRTVWVATVEMGTPFEEVLKPEYWVHVAAQLRQWHQIEVRSPDGKWFAVLMVQAADRLWAKVAVLHRWDFEAQSAAFEVPVPETPDHEVKWRGPNAKWCVVRLEDRAVLFENGATKTDAAIWLTRHLAALAA